MPLTTADEKYLRRALQVAQDARAHGNHPFGAVLVGSDGAVLLDGENTVNTDHDPTAHAESNLVRAACKQFDRSILLGSTLYASTEPCPMCSGAIFWGNIGRVVYALSESTLYSLAPDSTDQLPLGCREVLQQGARKIEVLGPFLEDEASQVHAGYWQ